MKAAQMRDMTVEELNRKIEDCVVELFNLRFQKAKGLLDNPARIRVVKKDMARIKTIITEKTNVQ